MEGLSEYQLSVLILSGDSLSLQGLTSFLKQEAMTTVFPLESVSQLTQDTVAMADVLVWDLGRDSGPGDYGEEWEAVRELIEDGMPVIAILPDSEATGLLRQIGVAGILSRTGQARRLLAALHAVSAGLTVTDPKLTGPRPSPSPSSAKPLPEPLTPRELEVLRLLAEGVTNRAIGTRLGISANTAKFHVQAVLGKIGVSSRTEAVVQATRLGLLTL